MTNKEIARSLKNTANMIDLTGGNPHRSRALSNAGRTIERLEESVAHLLESGQLTTIRGIGDRLAAQIQELMETGTFEAREELLGAIPAGVLDIMRVKGLGAKKVRVLWQELNIISLSELEQAAAVGKLASLDGFGEKTQANILKNVQFLKQYATSLRYADVFLFMEPLLEALKNAPGIEDVQLTGAMRRKMEIIDLVELVIQTSDEAAAQHALETVLTEATISEGSDAGLSQSDGALEGTLSNGLPVRIFVTEERAAGTMLWRSTGSAAHVEAFVATHGVPASLPHEHLVYEAAQLDAIPPELREGTDELEHARAGTLPTLIRVDDLKGTLHNHSTYSDGAHSLKEMVARAHDMGLSYFGICDHSQSLKIANGLSIDRVREQQEEIAVLNAHYETHATTPFRVFSGIESDILADGSLDYPAEVLSSFDFVVASVHTRMNMSEEEATRRIITAVENPYTTILGHPTGRILLVREGYPVDYNQVLDACVQHNVAIELNANPYRLDIDWRWIREATRRGLYISINPDAHAMDGLYDVRWGTEVARKGWLTAEQCLNALPLDAFADWLTNR